MVNQPLVARRSIDPPFLNFYNSGCLFNPYINIIFIETEFVLLRAILGVLSSTDELNNIETQDNNVIIYLFYTSEKYYYN